MSLPPARLNGAMFARLGGEEEALRGRHRPGRPDCRRRLRRRRAPGRERAERQLRRRGRQRDVPREAEAGAKLRARDHRAQPGRRGRPERRGDRRGPRLPRDAARTWPTPSARSSRSTACRARSAGSPRPRTPRPLGCDTAYVNTWACGPLKPGARARRFVWTVTAVKAGPYEVSWRVAAGLNGKAKAVAAGGGAAPSGSFSGTVSSAAPEGAHRRRRQDRRHRDSLT